MSLALVTHRDRYPAKSDSPNKRKLPCSLLLKFERQYRLMWVRLVVWCMWSAAVIALAAGAVRFGRLMKPGSL